VSRAVDVGHAGDGERDREVLRVDVGDGEDEVIWAASLRGLRARGLHGVRMVISDAHAAVEASIARVFTGASWQRSAINMLGEWEVPARCLRRR
jgi:transposase-like protein